MKEQLRRVAAWLKKYRKQESAAVLLVVVLAAAFWYSGATESLPTETFPSAAESSQAAEEPGRTPGEKRGETQNDQQTENAKETPQKSSDPSPEKGRESGEDTAPAAPSPAKTGPVDPQDAEVTQEEYICTLSVRCDSILAHMDQLDADKAALVPADGVIFPETEVAFSEGESVFDVLQREMKNAGIQMEFENTPAYHSAYIKGIQNLYEFDCGALSGWMYRVNGWFPNYGCSQYHLQDGDKVEWIYSCDMGADIGGSSAAGG